MSIFLRGSRLDDLQENGWTALHVAASNNRPDAVKVLLEAGAITGIKNNEDETALDLAESNGHQKVVDIIRGHLAGIYRLYHLGFI